MTDTILLVGGGLVIAVAHMLIFYVGVRVMYPEKFKHENIWRP